MTDIDETTTENPVNSIPVGRQLLILAIILLLIFGAGYLPKFMASLEVTAAPDSPDAPIENLIATVPDAVDSVEPFAEMAIGADAAFVWDVTAQKALYSKNPDRQLPLASITKLMTALVAYELVESDTPVPITPEILTQDGYGDVNDGEIFSMKSILDLTLLNSSNDGAFAIASVTGSQLRADDGPNAFVEAMNVRASELGLTQTFFRNPTGLDISMDESGAYSSARDVTFLMEHILTHYPQLIESTQETTAAISNTNGTRRAIDNTNPTVAQIEGLIGSKTGYTDLAGGNLTIAFDAALNRPIIVVVLGSSYSGRFRDVLALSEEARSAVAR
ncbi:serine hydrolase [Candidatus Pacebacteria bacterium]|nr:serine hydrolase [Candidatus Paceibacterota bacterium]